MENQLFKAIEEQCSIEALQKFISDVENVNLKNCSGEAALHIVIRKWSDKRHKPQKNVDSIEVEVEPKIVQAVQLLINAGADVNSKNIYGQSVMEALITSSYRGEKLFEILEILIKAGADVKSKNSDGQTVLHLAAKDQYNQVDFIRFLLIHGVDIDSQDRDGYTALQYAVQKPNKEVIECLIEAGADVKLLDVAANALGFTALQKLMQKHTEVVEYLADAGMDNNSVTWKGDILLHLAARVLNIDLIKYLINRDANVHAKNKTGRTPLHSLVGPYRIYKDEHLFADALEVLLSAKADVSTIEVTHGNTPLHYFIDNQNDEDDDNYNQFSDSIDLKTTESLFKIIKNFLKYRADFKIKNLRDGMLMEIFLLNCYRYENFNYLMVLLNTLIKYSIIDVDSLFITRWLNRRKILHESCYLINYNMIKLMVNYGANIEAVDDDMETPLLKIVRGIINAENPSENRKILDYFLRLNPEVNVITPAGLHILNLDDHWSPEYPEFLWKALIEYIAKKQFFGYKLHNSILQTITEEIKYQSYLRKCARELKCMQYLKFYWMILRDILMNHNEKIVRYAKNKMLSRETRVLLARKYPIYGPSIVKKFSKAIQKLEIMEKSAVILSSCLPCQLDPSHLVISKIISNLEGKYLRYLCEPESEELQLKIKTEIELNEFKISLDKYVRSCLKI